MPYQWSITSTLSVRWQVTRILGAWTLAVAMKDALNGKFSGGSRTHCSEFGADRGIRKRSAQISMQARSFRLGSSGVEIA